MIGSFFLSSMARCISIYHRVLVRRGYAVDDVERGAQGDKCFRIGGKSGRLTCMSMLLKAGGPGGALAIVGR